ncbi:hypothetical protein BKA62DRAFT_697542 [Auriculariales sp. MPI-PUGE-AT-0066]|nr:hypothetical protein BKA62DRAFT_697542 [Auriculariales sp. MPI-PUGE-AT-0066]
MDLPPRLSGSVSTFHRTLKHIPTDWALFRGLDHREAMSGDRLVSRSCRSPNYPLRLAVVIRLLIRRRTRHRRRDDVNPHIMSSHGRDAGREGRGPAGSTAAFECPACHSQFISRELLHLHVTQIHPQTPVPQPTHSDSMLRSATPAPARAAHPLLARSMTPAPSSAQVRSPAPPPPALSLHAPRSIPPSLAGFTFGTSAILPLPLPPIPSGNSVPNPHPRPYSLDGWNGTLPGPARHA